MKTILVISFMLIAETAFAAGQIGGASPCIKSATRDCAGGSYPGGTSEQCSWMTHLTCEAWRGRGLCVGISNPDGCIDGTDYHRIRRNVPLND